ncbi:MAG: UMP kinase [Candidatus Paceibacterota bacterium]
MPKLKYKRILLKISGEVFGENGKGISLASYEQMAKQIIKIKKENKIDLAIVIGAGNIFRGRFAKGANFDMAIAHQMGMVATIINGLALQQCLEKMGLETRMMTAMRIDAVAEPYLRRKALHHFEKGRIIIFAGGTGNPFFTTDSAAALRACELNCDLILKATNVDGVFDKDPNKYKDAKLYKKLKYKEAIEKDLNVMDGTAFALCADNQKPIIVFNLNKLDSITKALKGESFGTLVD